MAITLLEGSTFCICDEQGDVEGVRAGLYALDTRFLSRCVLTVNGARPLLLSGGTIEHYSAAFFCRNAPFDGLEPNDVAIRRERFVGTLMHDRVTVESLARKPVAVTLALELESDFADIFSVKGLDFELGDPAPPRDPARAQPPRVGQDATALVWEDAGSRLSTRVVLSRPAAIDGGTVSWSLTLEPGTRWSVDVYVVPSAEDEELVPAALEERLAAEQALAEGSLASWRSLVPRLEASRQELEDAYRRSVADLASLRIGTGREGEFVFAAGMPWFMTVFGRDTAIASLQTLLLGPELGQGAARFLAGTQAERDDPANDAEPGKVVHELRHGKTAAAWTPGYYGTADATPLFLVLLSEVWRWGGDPALALELRDSALRALEWVDRFGDRDGDGFVEYLRRSPYGIRNQVWKDSDASMVFRDGTLAEAPLAAAEVQGYVYDAKLRLAEIARAVWEDADTAGRLEREAAELRARFDEAFWCDGGWYALALDADKRRVDGLGSNIGHLLWSGIVPEERVDDLVGHLTGSALWSGWGVRTLAADQPGYNPLAYHNGTVWPHDNSLIAAGLARYGRWEAARRIVRAMIEASTCFDHQLPEVFSGFDRRETPFPVPYPTATRPQAWAAATPVLLLQVLLGLEPDVAAGRLVARAPGLPEWAGELRLTGVRALGRTWDVDADADGVRVVARH